MPRNTKPASKTKAAASRPRSAPARKKPLLGSFLVKDSYDDILQAQLDATLARVKKMTQAELVESLKACGVLTPSGKLAKQYRD